MGHTRASLANTAYRRIRRMIIRAELVPGYRFTELALAEQLELGKTPVREALGRLVQDGLVESVPRVGYRITPITLRDVVELFDFRLIVEPASSRMAAARVSRELEYELIEILEARLPDPSSSGYLDAVSELNHRLHLTIAQSCGNELLKQAVEETLEGGERIYRLVLVDMLPSGDHRQLVEAVIKGDGDLASEISHHHIDQVRELILESYLTSQPVLDAELVIPRQGD